jgi:hypothetical protein
MANPRILLLIQQSRLHQLYLKVLVDLQKFCHNKMANVQMIRNNYIENGKVRECYVPVVKEGYSPAPGTPEYAKYIKFLSDRRFPGIAQMQAQHNAALARQAAAAKAASNAAAASAAKQQTLNDKLFLLTRTGADRVYVTTDAYGNPYRRNIPYTVTSIPLFDAFVQSVQRDIERQKMVVILQQKEQAVAQDILDRRYYVATINTGQKYNKPLPPDVKTYDQLVYWIKHRLGPEEHFTPLTWLQTKFTQAKTWISSKL